MVRTLHNRNFETSVSLLGVCLMQSFSIDRSQDLLARLEHCKFHVFGRKSKGRLTSAANRLQQISYISDCDIAPVFVSYVMMPLFHLNDQRQQSVHCDVRYDSV